MRFWIRWTILAIAWLGAMFLIAPYDLSISEALADRGAWDGIAVFRLGEIPGWIAIVFSIFVLLKAHLTNNSSWKEYKPLATAIIVQALLLPLAITQAFKYLWGRVRFMHLAADFSNYTTFWKPAGMGAGASFPSGHVAMAALLACVPFFLWQSKRHKAAWTSGILIALWGIFVSWGRIRSGSHYLTDCVMSMGLGWFGAALILHFLRKKTKG